MDVKGDKNPLLDTQREKAGAVTFAKYQYQYHWALYRMLKEHSEKKEYAVFIELHEDVIVSNSLDSESAQFEFNQVKTTGKKFTVGALTTPPAKKKGSILGLLINSSTGRSFSDKIRSLNLVSVQPFSLKLKDEVDLELKKISVDDLHEDTLKSLISKLKAEIGIDALPANLHFIVSDLSESSFKEVVIAQIATIIAEMFPESYCNPIHIYHALYDEAQRKGIVTTDFKSWSDLINLKAITSPTVAEVISRFTNIKDESHIQNQFNNIVSELSLKSIAAKELERSFTRYRQKKIGSRTTLQLDTSAHLRELITSEIDMGVAEMPILIDNVSKKINSSIKNQFVTKVELNAAIICEFIMM
jgi:hypothetical protein